MIKTEVEKKIKDYCKDINMDLDKLEIVEIVDGYMVTDGDTSLTFNEDGRVDSLPMYKAYGKSNFIIGKVISIIFLIVILVFIAIFVFEMLK